MKFCLPIIFVFTSLFSQAQKKILKASDGSVATVSGPIKLTKIVVGLDTTTSAKFACVDIYIPGITGTNFSEMLNANHSYYVLDAKGAKVPINEKVMKKVNGSMEDNLVNYTIKLPFKLKNDLTKNFTVYYHLETKDKTKTIDLEVHTK